jgi:hypothetical protein
MPIPERRGEKALQRCSQYSAVDLDFRGIYEEALFMAEIVQKCPYSH